MLSVLHPVRPLNGLRALIRLVFPPLCIACGKVVESPGCLCPECWNQIHFLDGPVCAVCGRPFAVDPGPGAVCSACLANPPAFDSARAVMRYAETSKRPILALKHADKPELAPAMAGWMARAGHEFIIASDIIVPVPLHRGRLWRRRYNQAAELARALSRHTGLPSAPQALIRIRATPSQGEMPSAKARHRNVQGAFAVPKDRRAEVSGKRVLLVDDVMTTGASLQACARTLKRAGAERVFCLSLALVSRDSLDQL